MKKEGIVILLILGVFAFAAAASAAATFSTPDAAVNAAYTCLKNGTFNKTTLSLQESIFSSLAQGYMNNTDTIIWKNRVSDASGTCWPSPTCNLKETAQVALVYESMHKNTSDIEKWILKNNISVTGLQWSLEIDATAHTPSVCTVIDSSGTSNVNIGADMKLSGSMSSCLSVSSSGYLLSISPSCLDRSFDVSCDQDFVSTLLYTKTGGSTLYVSSDTHGASGSGHTLEHVGARCFGTGGACDYEGSLWSAMALQQIGYDVSSFLPYLVATAEDNQRLLPSSFLYILTNGQDWFDELIKQQKTGNYWEANSSGNRFYDTGLALLALYNTPSSAEKDNAATWLMNVQGTNGCWNNGNLRDTAMILWAGWPQTIPNPPGNNDNNTGEPWPPICTNCTSNPPTSGCVSAGYQCTSTYACYGAGGIAVSSYDDCPQLEKCCSISIAPLQTCAELSGIICQSGQDCSGNVQTSSDGTCCIGSCQTSQVVTNTCESSGTGVCQSECASDATISTDSVNGICSPGMVCCVSNTTPQPTPGSSLWIWLLIGILIILVVIGILYRDKLRMWMFKLQGKLKTTPVRGPPAQIGGIRPPQMMQRRPLQLGGLGAQRPMNPFGPATARPLPKPAAPVQPAPAKKPEAPKGKEGKGKDSDFEETLKKLREMSK